MREGGIRTDADGYIGYLLAEAREALSAEGVDVRIRYTVDPHRTVQDVDAWTVVAVRRDTGGKVELVAGALPSLPRERTEN